MSGPFGAAPKADLMRLGWERWLRYHPDGGMERRQFRKAVEAYCRGAAARLAATGYADLPCDMGSLVAVAIRRRPRWDRTRGAYRSADAVDWRATRERGEVVRRDGRDTLGFVLAPKEAKGRGNAKCLGFVADRGLYSGVKARYDAGTLGFPLPDVDDIIV